MRRGLALWTLGLLAACRPAVNQVVHDWLHCEECNGQELEQLRGRGDATVGPLVEALIVGPSPAQIANIVAQTEADRGAAERFRNRTPAAVTATAAASAIDSSDFAGAYVTAYIEGYRRRALLGLAEVGTRAAIDSIKAVVSRDSVTPIGWGDAVHEMARAFSHGVTDLSVVPLPVMAPGQSRQALVNVTTRPGVAAPVIWTSYDPAIATVSSNGVVAALTAGTARIRACIVGLPGTCVLTPVRVQ